MQDKDLTSDARAEGNKDNYVEIKNIVRHAYANDEALKLAWPDEGR